MPQINVLYWNVENFGVTTVFKNPYQALAGLIAWTAQVNAADVILIQEVKQAVLANPSPLTLLHQALNGLPAPQNNWYCDVIKGSVSMAGAPPEPPATSADLDWDAGHNEGYAVFWNQNIAKFRVTPAPPPGALPPAGPENTQSESVRLVPGAPVAFPAPPPAPAGIRVPAGANQYSVPVGTEYPGQVPLAAAQLKTAGEELPAQTKIGPAGVTLAQPPPNFNPVLIPGGYELTEALPLPAAQQVLVPAHALALVLRGRDTRNAAGEPSALVGNVAALPFQAPLGAGQMQDLWFTRGGGHPASNRGPRRPAYLTLDVQKTPARPAAERLVPLIVYHAPLAAAAAASGMQRASYSQPLYQAFDWGAEAWIANQRAVLGGDLNVRLETSAYAYGAFSRNFAEGGAECKARVYAGPAPGRTRATTQANRTTVQITKRSRQKGVMPLPILSPHLTRYRRFAIDNVFYRGFAAAEAPPVPPASTAFALLDAAARQGPANTNMPAAIIQAFLTVEALNLHLQAGNPNSGVWNPPPLPSVQSAPSLVGKLAQGDLTAPPHLAVPWARTAAEFVRLCISDHYPVLFRMEL